MIKQQIYPACINECIYRRPVSRTGQLQSQLKSTPVEMNPTTRRVQFDSVKINMYNLPEEEIKYKRKFLIDRNGEYAREAQVLDDISYWVQQDSISKAFYPETTRLDLFLETKQYDAAQAIGLCTLDQLASPISQHLEEQWGAKKVGFIENSQHVMICINIIANSVMKMLPYDLNNNMEDIHSFCHDTFHLTKFILMPNLGHQQFMDAFN